MEPMHAENFPRQPHRRGFFKKALAAVIGVFIGSCPVASGLKVFLDPLRRKSSTSEAVRLTTLEALPIDGVPRIFRVIADRVDAWNKFPQVAIGAVYLRRTGENVVEALNVVCPHAGGFVDFVPGSSCFICPLHQSKFAIDGKINDRKSPAPRGMDALEVEIRNANEVWVKFQNFQAGRSDKVPIA
jgi:menaquinol-cytochrome c reductase iron-sulfur subunit